MIGKETLGIWTCPECDTDFIGVDSGECLDHLFRCGAPEIEYSGRVYLGVKGQYKEHVKWLIEATRNITLWDKGVDSE